MARKPWVFFIPTPTSDPILLEGVTQVNWRFGERPVNQFGYVAKPADGLVVLENTDLLWKTFAPAALPGGVDPQTRVVPGARIVVAWGLSVDEVLDKTTTPHSIKPHLVIASGRSKGLIQSATGTKRLAQLPFVGELGWFDERRKVFLRLSGQQTPGTVWKAVLEDVAFEGVSQILHTSNTKVRTSKLHQQGVLGQGRRRTRLTAVARALAQVEVGRVYDSMNRQAIIFEGRYHRTIRYKDAKRFVVGPNGYDPTLLESLPVADSVVNVLSADIDAFDSMGEQEIKFDPGGRIRDFSFQVPANADNWLAMSLDVRVEEDGQQFVQSWKALERGEHFTYSTTDEPVVRSNGVQWELYLTNHTSRPQTFLLKKIEGEPFKFSSRQHVKVRREASVELYGEREVVYPVSLVSDRDEVQDQVNFLVRMHDGVIETGLTGAAPKVDPIRTLNARFRMEDPINEGMQYVDVSDLFLVTDEGLGLTSAPFWVDEVAQSYTGLGRHEVSVKLSDARGSIMWPIENMQFGYNTRTGF